MVLTKENRAVVINQQDGGCWANLYVNARNGISEAAITNLRWTGKTIEGAIRWANKQFEKK